MDVMLPARMPISARYQGEPEPWRFEFRAHVESAVPLRDLSSPSHELDVRYASAHAAEEKRGVDRRDFTVPTSRTRLRIHPMIKPAALLVSAGIEKAQRVARALECRRLCDPVSFDGDADRC